MTSCEPGAKLPGILSYLYVRRSGAYPRWFLTYRLVACPLGGDKVRQRVGDICGPVARHQQIIVVDVDEIEHVTDFVGECPLRGRPNDHRSRRPRGVRRSAI